MASYNKVILMGNLTRDPDLRTTPKGSQVAQFGLAVNRNYRNAEGNTVDETTFVDIEAFGKQAEVIGKYLSKGRPIFVEGRLKLDQWESKEGEKRSKLKVILEAFQFVGGRGEGSEGGDYSDSPAPARRGASNSSSADIQDIPDDDDVPF
jgi:single-strand DNA-binding protein